MARGILLRCLLIVFITQLKVAKFDAEVEKEILRYFEGGGVKKEKYPLYLHLLENAVIMKGYSFVNLLHYDEKYTTFTVTKNNANFLFKVIYETEKDHKLCDIEQRNFEMEVYRKNIHSVSYIYETIAFWHEKYEVDYLIHYYYCTSISELEPTHIINSEMFILENERDKKYFSYELFILIGKVIIAIAEMNFKSNVLHRDIHIDSIGVKRIGGNLKLCEKYDPVIMGLDRMIQDPSHYLVKASEIKGENNYILPETKEKLEKQFTKTEFYPYSRGFVEDAYALGPVILEIIQNYEHIINNEDPGIVKLKAIANRMIKGVKETNPRNPSDIQIIRMDMKEVLDLYYEAMKSSIEVGKFNPYRDFLPRVEEVIKSLKIKRFFI